MESDDSALSKLVQTEAKKSGISSKDAKKAMKKLRSGGMMAQIAPQLHSQFMEMDPNLTARDKYRAKMKKLQNGRITKVAKSAQYEKERLDVIRRKEEAELAVIQKKKEEEQHKRNHAKKLKQLEKKLGVVTHELYNTCMRRLQNNDYTDQDLCKRDRNIMELYSKQQSFTDEINMDDL
jgi:hypothetical protein